MKLLSDYKTYDNFGDLPCHDYLTMREWLLCNAFPATTLPMGANPLTGLGNKNIDMSAVAIPDGKGGFTGGCKINEAHWPRDDDFIKGNKDWHHSDYKDVPYLFTYPFYQKIIKEIKANP